MTELSITSIALIGFGEVGQMLAQEFVSCGDLRVSAFDIAFVNQGSAQTAAAKAIGLCATRSPEEAVAGAQLVISAVTASSALDVAHSVTDHLQNGAFFLDVNSVAPGTKRAAAAVIALAEGRYVEAAVMAPVHPKRLRTPILLGGPHAASFAHVAQALGFGASVFSTQIGDASAVKMCRSVMIKGIEALTLECLLAASRAGVEKPVLASLKESFPTLDWPRIAEYNLERMATHGIRRSAEMREVAKTVRELGLEPLMATATAEHQATIGELRLRDRQEGSLPKGLQALLDAIHRADPWPDVPAQAAQ
jgi:3-hydroxyisobutyrate dehydrogenase-like beta-hydroxyacid dehydrogenase